MIGPIRVVAVVEDGILRGLYTQNPPDLEVITIDVDQDKEDFLILNRTEAGDIEDLDACGEVVALAMARLAVEPELNRLVLDSDGHAVEEEEDQKPQVGQPHPYILEGREIQDKESGQCIFCAAAIQHFNEDGRGWILGAVVDDNVKLFMYCDQPPCPQAEAHYDEEIWRCGCIRDYVENVGELCHGCRRPRAEALPYAS